MPPGAEQRPRVLRGAVGLDLASHPDAARFQAVLDEAVARSLPGVTLAVHNPRGLWVGDLVNERLPPLLEEARTRA